MTLVGHYPHMEVPHLSVGVTVVRRRHLVIAAIVLASAMIFAYQTCDQNTSFTPERWEECEPRYRFRYVESLMEEYELEGMDKATVEELLGPGTKATGVPDNGHSYEEYRIEDDLLGGWKVLLFEYDDGVVVSVRETWEDW